MPGSSESTRRDSFTGGRETGLQFHREELMNILKVLHHEEKKLLAVSGKIETKLYQIRAAINALGTNGTG